MANIHSRQTRMNQQRAVSKSIINGGVATTHQLIVNSGDHSSTTIQQQLETPPSPPTQLSTSTSSSSTTTTLSQCCPCPKFCESKCPCVMRLPHPQKCTNCPPLNHKPTSTCQNITDYPQQPRRSASATVNYNFGLTGATGFFTPTRSPPLSGRDHRGKTRSTQRKVPIEDNSTDSEIERKNEEESLTEQDKVISSLKKRLAEAEARAGKKEEEFAKLQLKLLDTVKQLSAATQAKLPSNSTTISNSKRSHPAAAAAATSINESPSKKQRTHEPIRTQENSSMKEAIERLALQVNELQKRILPANEFRVGSSAAARKRANRRERETLRQAQTYHSTTHAQSSTIRLLPPNHPYPYTYPPFYPTDFRSPW